VANFWFAASRKGGPGMPRNLVICLNQPFLNHGPSGRGKRWLQDDVLQFALRAHLS